MNESTLVKKILDALNRSPCCKAIKIHGNGYMETGTPDIIGAFNGKAFLIECKVQGNQPTLIQRRRIEEWKRAGAVALIADEAFSVQNFLDFMP